MSWTARKIDAHVVTLQLLKDFENLISASSLKRLGSLLTHCGIVVDDALGIVL